MGPSWQMPHILIASRHQAKHSKVGILQWVNWVLKCEHKYTVPVNLQHEMNMMENIFQSQASWGLRAIAPEFSAKIITAMFRSGHIDSEPRQFTTNWSWFAGPQRLKVACFWGSICELRPVFQWKRYLGCCRYWGSYHNFIACHHCLTANLKTMSQIFGYAVIHPSGLVPVIKHTRWVSTNVPSKFADPWRKTQRDSQTKTRHLQT